MKNIIFLFLVITLLGCEKFDELESSDNILADESIVLFEVTNVSFNAQSAFVSDVVISFTNNYDDLSSALKERVTQIAVYKDGFLQFTIQNPRATSFIDENETRGSNHCYQFSFAREIGTNTGQLGEISRRSEQECFEVE